MTPILVAGLAGAMASLLIALIQAVSKFSTNRAEATKISTDSKNVEADTAEVFSRLAAEWTQRADARVAKLEKHIENLVCAIENLTDAVDGVTPLLESSVTPSTPDAADKVVALRLASRAARRLAG